MPYFPKSRRALVAAEHAWLMSDSEDDDQLAMEELLPQEVGPGDTEALAKVNPMLDDVDGVDGEVPKAQYLREVMSGNLVGEGSKRKAIDRLRRVAGMHKFKQEKPEEADAAAETFLERSLHADDSVVALVRYSGDSERATAAVMTVQHMHKGDGSKRVGELTAADLDDPKARIEANVLRLLSVDEASAHLTYTEGNLGELLSVTATMALPINPEETLVEGKHGFKIEIAELQAALDMLVKANETRIAEAPKVTGTFAPYARGGQTILESARADELLNESVAAEQVTCRLCSQTWPSLQMRQHLGFHILSTPEKLASANPCGFCGGEAAMCRSWLETSKTTVNALTRCGLLGGTAGKPPLNYSHGSAKKMSNPAPCTNHLVPCEYCEPEQNQQRPCYWSYNLKAHHEKEHASHPLPACAAISDLEKELVMALGKAPKSSLSAEQKRRLKAVGAGA